MSLSALDLPWLPRAPDGLSARIRAAKSGAELRQLAGFALNGGQAASFGRALKRLSDEGGDPGPLSPLTLGVLSAHSFDLVRDALPVAAARHGVAVSIVAEAYGQVMQSALDPASRVSVARPDAVLAAVDHRWLGLDRPDLNGGPARVEQALRQAAGLLHGLRETAGGTAILQTLPVPPLSLFGSYDRRALGTVRSMIGAFNSGLLALADDWGALVLDAAAVAEGVGAERWFDPVHWLAHKLPFAPAAAPLYADHLGRLLGALRGKARKCLVLDLDNTLWGGAVGDDGLEGIVLGQGSAAGEAFLAVQAMALDLRARGVVLAVASKNDEATARAPFRSHSEMLLKEADIAVFQAHWEPKATSLEAIAQALNIGVDGLVLLDDNPAERAQMRAMLPAVAVPELPADAAWYPWTLQAAGYFEAISLSQEDLGRAAAYAVDADRTRLAGQAANLTDYLADLAMTLEVRPFDARGRSRVAQLINKTNQFNLTTRRYTEAEVKVFEEGGAAFTLQARLTDRFGDLGMISVLIARQAEDPAAWEIDTWLMSCRVLGRGVEQGVLAAAVGAARERGVQRLIGVYRPTAKNGMVAGHYEALGFTPMPGGEAGESRFRLEVSSHETPDLPFAV